MSLPTDPQPLLARLLELNTELAEADAALVQLEADQDRLNSDRAAAIRHRDALVNDQRELIEQLKTYTTASGVVVGGTA